MRTLKKLYTSKEYATNHICLGIIFAMGFLIYFIILYNFVTFKGNKLVIGIVFGSSEVAGIFLSARAMKIFKNPVTSFVATIVVILALMIVLHI